MRTFKPTYLCAAVLLVSFAITSAEEDPYSAYQELHGDLHVHSSTGSFDAKSCQGACKVFSVTEQLSEARAAGLDYVAITEHDLDPNDPSRKMTKNEWEQVLTAVSRASTEEFIAVAGYEWTSSQRSCFLDGAGDDYNHKIVILPPGAKDLCDSRTCKTPDELAMFVHGKGGIIITPHPWRVLLLDANGNVTSYVSRDYFAYSGDGPGDVMIGAEIGPPFQPFSWPGLLCDKPADSFQIRTVTIEEWIAALNSGKRLAAISSSDRHDSRTPFGSRTTSVFVKDKTGEGIIEALRARRTHAANLAPFHVRFSVDRYVVGSTVTGAKEAVIKLVAKPHEFEALEIWLGETMIRRLASLPPDGRLVVPLDKIGKGPLWIKIVGKETDTSTHTPRTTITSPIWLQ